MTTMDYCKKYLQSRDMSSVHISLDMQLYMVAVQVKWSDPERWREALRILGACLSCMTYCRCEDSQDECHNPLTKKYDDDTSDD